MWIDYEPVRQYDNIVDCYCKVVKKDGFLGLFKLFGYNLLTRLIDSAFEAYCYFKNQLNDLSNGEFNGDKSWKLYGVRTLNYLAIYFISRLQYYRLLDVKPDFRLGLGLFDDFWVIASPHVVNLCLKLWRTVNK